VISLESASDPESSVNAFEQASTSRTLPVGLGGLSDYVIGAADRPVLADLEGTKRAMDVVIASVLLALAAPVLLPAMVAICISSPGWPIFTQSRIGRHGKPFKFCKLRTMRKRGVTNRGSLHAVTDTTTTGPVMKVQQDPRVFPVGRFLRRTSIDEIPNLVNVLCGDMSIVGPRPMQAVEIEYCAERYGDQFNASRLAVKPGITGLWQVSGRSGLHFDERVRLDVMYAATWTPLADLKIIASTVPAVLFNRGAY
jgi:lipopolysaccharide/colanic/teichoic acid biosynthesis glycosyltransferase